MADDIPFNTPDGPKSYISAEQLQLQELGQQGKLWTITIVYLLDTETKSIPHRNLTNPQVMKIRGDIFQFGFLHPIRPGSWRIICPVDIHAVYLDRQSGYFSE